MFPLSLKKLVCSYFTRRKLRCAGRIRPRAGYPSDDLLRVVRVENGEEIARIETKFFPTGVSFVPEGRSIFYLEPQSDSEYAPRLWDYQARSSQRCSPDNQFGLSNVTFVNGRSAVATLLEERTRQASLVRLTLPRCVRTILGAADPLDTKSYRAFGPLSISVDRQHVAYRAPGAN